ncbi:hypothetical protein EYZ11_002862 [Aspergillus tanneri]|uniref:Uncharacterized protein n=1 Tax=Aspergillus tanneri TaxID=1220188 RepID=A0A4S3JPQ8_9EURO|nr:hypothetical protein EYZ11_002862 [Aspergillus tanneri]
MEEEVDDYPPPWGTIIIEQYLIRNWSYSSPKEPNQQRQRLIQEFLEMEDVPETWEFFKDPPPRLPTEEEINVILRPWRSDDNIR